jgi:mRNA-degrading endonuclease RelE of RelBE toxin-antitoxin system
MVYNLIITPEADKNIADACVYYDGVLEGLSEQFLLDLLSIYQVLIENPQYFSYISPKKNNELRDVKIGKFPYVVIFDIKDHVVTVYSVFHTSQKPKYR